MKYLRRVVQAGFLLAAAGFFALCIVELARSPALNSLWLVVQLRRFGNPVVHLVGSLLGIAPSSALGKFLPLALALAALVLLVVVDYLLCKVSVGVTAVLAARKRRMAARPPAPVAQPPRVEAVRQEPPRPSPAPHPMAEEGRHARQEARPQSKGEPRPQVKIEPEPGPEAAAPSDEATLLLQTSPGGEVPGGVEEVEAGIPKQIGRYDILEELGRGAMGVVYKGRDPLLRRTVAIKEILATNLPGDELSRYKQRFFREAEVAARMNHPAIVTIYDVGEDQATGQPYLVMEFVEGTTLEEVLEGSGGSLPLDRSLDIGIRVARLLDYVHQKGVVHRDIKPANIMILPDGEIEIMDLGVARLEGSQMTQAGQVLGSPAYMSPEQFMGGGIDGRSDIFSLGIVLYQMLTGKMAFPGATVTDIIVKIVQSTPTPVTELNRDLPPEVHIILSKCLAKAPEERYQTGSELAADLEALRARRGSRGVASEAPKTRRIPACFSARSIAGLWRAC